MKILFTADQHIKLKSKNIPKDWQKNRFLMLADKLDTIFTENKCDLHIIGGDLLDVPNPSSEELELMFAFLDKLKHKGYIYSGNHEAINKKTSCLYHLADAISSATNNLWEVIKEPYRSKDFDIIDYMELHNKTWVPAFSNLCFTHVRGSIPPHVKPEIDLNKFVNSGYNLVVAGDLHSYTNTQDIDSNVKLLYPGSPITTSFHRGRQDSSNGAFIIDTDSLSYDWINLTELPQLIRKTVDNPKDMLPGEYDHIIYEITGDIVDLKNIKADSELFDKKLNNVVTKEARLDLANKTLKEEIALYLKEVQNLSEDKIQSVISRITPYVKDNS